MNKNNEREDFRVYGILSVEEITGKVFLRQVEELVSYHLQLDAYYEAIYYILQHEYNIDVKEEKCKIEIQTVYSAFHHTLFYQKIPKFLNNRTTESNVKICKVGLLLVQNNLLAMKDIKNALNSFFLQEIDHLATGLPFEADILNSLLWQFNKTISRDVLDMWMQKAIPYLETQNPLQKVIQAHEFLFLVVNCVDRIEYFKRTPAPHMDRTKEPKFSRIYKIDSKNYGLDYAKNPDERIQTYMKYQYDSNKMIYEGRPSEREKRQEFKNSKNKIHFAKFQSQGQNFKSEFKTLLNDMELYEEIQLAKKNAKKLINLAKLNGQRAQKKKASIAEDLNLQFEDQNNSQSQDSQQYISNKQLRPQTASATKSSQLPRPSQIIQSKIEKIRKNQTYQNKQMERPISGPIQQIKEEVRLHREMMQDPHFQQKMKGELNQNVGQKKRPSTSQKLTHSKIIRPQTAQRRASKLLINTLPSTSKPQQQRPQSGFFSTTTAASQNKSLLGNFKKNPSFSQSQWKLNQPPMQRKVVSINSIQQQIPLGDGSKGWNNSIKQFKKSNIVQTYVDKQDHIEDLSLQPQAIYMNDELCEQLESWEHYQKGPNDNQVFVPYGNVSKNNFSVKVPWSASTKNISTYITQE